MSDLPLGSPWAPYGLREDPFFQQALQPTTDSEAPRPITLFVGRDTELQLLANQVLGSSNSRAIIEGDAGVGKTSFVSRLKSELAKHDVLSHLEPVRVRPGMTAQQFAAEILKVLLQIHATVAKSESTGAVSRAGRAVRQAAALDAESAFWRRVGRLIEGEDSAAGGFTVGLVGAQTERVRIPAEVGDLSLFNEIAQAAEYVTRQGERRLLLHINNLENLSLEQSAQAARLMQEMRDCFLADYCHWLFVGTTGIQDQIFRVSEQVSGIIPVSITLGPLEPDEVAELLARRYRHLQRGLQLTPPITPDDGATLYRRYHGQLRAFLSLMSTAAQRFAASSPGTTLTVANVVSTMAPTVRAMISGRRVSTSDLAHLTQIFAGKPHDAEFRATDVALATGISQASASQFVQRLLEAGVIHLVRTQGRSNYYRLANGDLTIALNLP